MTVHRRRRPRGLKGGTLVRDRAIVTGNRRIELDFAAHRRHADRLHGGGSGGAGDDSGGEGAGGGDGDLGARLREAAEIIADQARVNAGWSVKIPPSIRVSGGAGGVSILSDAPNSYPAELRARHPLFGNRRHWYGPPGAPFLAPAADEAGDEALDAFAQVIDDWAKERGYK